MFLVSYFSQMNLPTYNGFLFLRKKKNKKALLSAVLLSSGY